VSITSTLHKCKKCSLYIRYMRHAVSKWVTHQKQQKSQKVVSQHHIAQNQSVPVYTYSEYIHTVLLLTLTRVMGARHSSTSICVSVCPHNRTQNSWNYNHKSCHRDIPSWVLVTHLILGQKVKITGSQSAKTLQSKAIKRPAWICTSYRVASI